MNTEWVAYPFSRGSSGPRNHTRVSSIADRFSTNWVTKAAPTIVYFTANQKSIHFRDEVVYLD